MNTVQISRQIERISNALDLIEQGVIKAEKVRAMLMELQGEAPRPIVKGAASKWATIQSTSSALFDLGYGTTFRHPTDEEDMDAYSPEEIEEMENAGPLYICLDKSSDLREGNFIAKKIRNAMGREAFRFEITIHPSFSCFPAYVQIALK